MIRIKSKLVLGALVVGSLAGSTAQAQSQSPDLRLLGYNATLSAVCNVGCTQLVLSLALDGTRPTDNRGMPVPGAISALDQYLRNATFQVFGTNPTITGVTGVPSTFVSSIDNGPSNFAALVLTDQALPLSANSLGLTLTLASGANVAGVSASGLGYVSANLSILNADGTVRSVPPQLPPPPGGPFYQTGDFNVFVSPSTDLGINAVPEPSTYVLMATGLAALFGVARRRNSRV